MKKEKLQGERVYYHADPDWPETQVCWQPCSDCLSGMIRYEDEEEAERVLVELRR